MNREEKELVVQGLKEKISQSEASFLINCRGLTVNQMQQLRRQLYEKNGSLKVAKARLMKRAVDGVDGVDGLTDYFRDQVGLVFADQEATEVAKVLRDFSKRNNSLELVAGYFDDQVLVAEHVARIASLPSREVLLGQVAGVLKAPITKLANVLHVMPSRLALALKQVEEKKQEG